MDPVVHFEMPYENPDRRQETKRQVTTNNSGKHHPSQRRLLFEE
jgi:hypothetical protein